MRNAMNLTNEPDLFERAPGELTRDHPKLNVLRDAMSTHLVASRYSNTGEIYRPTTVYASRRKPCVRAMALDMIYPEDQGEFEPSVLARFATGSEREADINARLNHAAKFADPSFSVIAGQERFEIQDRDGMPIIVGKIDGRLKFGNDDKPPFEIKTGDGVRHADSIEGLDRGSFTRHYVDQLLVYLLGLNEPWGFFILDRASFPELVPLFLEEHLQRAEGFMNDARRAVEARQGLKPLPDPISDASICRRCPHFGKSCEPPIAVAEGLFVSDSPELVEAAETRERTRSARDEYESADKRLKKSLHGNAEGIVGPFAFKGRWSPRTSYDVPLDVKTCFKRVTEQGSWTLVSIERVDKTQGDLE